ncbi:MAG: Sensory box histidine kinase/response regulator [Myxococcales bacterium]|nr:Sensory box histidine kinase/response regulator [Myxococcales bacterium]
MNLAELVAQQHDALLERFVGEARKFPEAEGVDRVELIDSMSFFLDDVVAALAGETRIARGDSAAGSHGVERLRLGFRIDRVVREYALIGQLILEMAAAREVQPTPQEQVLLLRTVSDGAAIAASEYMRRRESDVAAREAAHAGFLAHELRNSLASARFAFDVLRRRVAGDVVSLVNIVDASLRQANQHLDDALAGARLRGGVVSSVPVFLGLMIDEIATEITPQASEKRLALEIDADRRLELTGDPRLIRSALTNLMQNAVKFSRPGGKVQVRARAHAGEMIVDVEDACGGIAADKIDRIFAPFEQAGSDGSGFGLGLVIARDSAEAQGGSLRVQNVPDRGCVFTLSLPRPRVT